MVSMAEVFFELLQVALGRRDKFSRAITADEWRALFDMAQKQAVVGVCRAGLMRLPAEQWPPRGVVLEWEAACSRIEQRNRTVNEATAFVAFRFGYWGFRTCILKGQGNAVAYPDPMARTPGDIDVWLDGGCWRIIHFAVRDSVGGKIYYHHIEWNWCGDVPVEVHYRPSFMFNPIHNHRLQKWFRMNFDACQANKIDLPEGAGSVVVPTFEFNVVFQLAHMFNHFLHKGVGLKQFVDYYYLLVTNRERLMADERVRAELEATISRFGLYDFSRAVMWVMERVFMLDRDCMISVPDERLGRLLVDEIMLGGNFGKYDTRVLTSAHPTPLQRNIARLYRDIRLCRFFPSECLCEPFFRIWHFCLRLIYRFAYRWVY